MSTSSITSSRRRRRCEYGDEHVDREKYDDKKREIRNLREKIEEKDGELLKYHNELAEAQLLLEKEKGETKKLENEVEKHIEDYNKTIDEHEKEIETFNRLNETYNELREKRKRETLQFEQDIKKLKTQVEAAELRKSSLDVPYNISPIDKLAAFRTLHPGLKSLEPENLAQELREVLTFQLNDIWNQLPGRPEEELITPTTWRIDLVLERLKTAITNQPRCPNPTEHKEIDALRKEQQDHAEIEKKLENKLVQIKKQRLTDWETFCPDPENIKTPQQLREWIAGLKRQEQHADGLVVANQALIFEWENNVGVPLIGETRDFTPQAAGTKLQQLLDRLKDLEGRNSEFLQLRRQTIGPDPQAHAPNSLVTQIA